MPIYTAERPLFQNSIKLLFHLTEFSRSCSFFYSLPTLIHIVYTTETFQYNFSHNAIPISLEKVSTKTAERTTKCSPNSEQNAYTSLDISAHSYSLRTLIHRTINKTPIFIGIYTWLLTFRLGSGANTATLHTLVLFAAISLSLLTIFPECALFYMVN